MNPSEYTTTLTTLGLTTTQAADWLGVSVRTAQRYAKTGPCGPAARALTTELERIALDGYCDSLKWELAGK